jgi:LPS-assembly protein
MPRFSLITLACFVLSWFGAATPARAQTGLGGCRVYKAQYLTAEGGRENQNHSLFMGDVTVPVQIDCDEMQFFADRMEIFHDKDLVMASGHVVFVSGGNRISAERMEFNTRTRTGTFYNADGTATLGDRVDRSMFGTQEPDAYFWGEELQKLGPKKYKITRGGFTTCVQPTPRWAMGSRSITLNLDDYALLTNAVFKVKGVPLMYLPVFYYPIQEDDRATGFLIPTYGNSTLRGQTISNAFFWAIGRSHDATFFHDWYSKTGQGFGAEYRYVLGPGSQGNARGNFLNEHAATYQASNGTELPLEARRSYQMVGSMTQTLPRRLRARANVDYFSSIQPQQRYQQNIFHATNSTRRIAGNVSGSWAEYVFSATGERSDIFTDIGTDTVTTYGALPRVSVSRGERPVAGLPIYVGASAEYATLLRSTTRDDVKINDQGVTRVDVNPSIRVPFTRWPFLTVNTSVWWRGTYWTESLDAGVQVSDGIGRQFFDVQSRITGPVFNRIWNTPGRGYAEKFKHVVEPTLTIRRTTAIDNFDRIVRLEGTDFDRGDLTRFVYGLSNRLYAKKQASREIASITLSQTYYTDPDAAQYDRQYQTSFSGTAPTHYSPLAVEIRATPTDRFRAEFRTYWDPTAHALQTLSASGSYSHGDWLSATGSWSQRRYIPGLTGFERERADHYVGGSANFRRLGNKVGGTYSFNYDLRRDSFLQQRYLAYYNAQCCGVAIEYQTFNLQGTFTGFAVPQDRRFNLSFTLAGIGTFSNFFGALGGQQDR